MKKFLFRISITLLSLFVVAFLLDVVITNNLHNSNKRLFRSWNDIFFDDKDYDVLIMGSSRAFVQFSPKILDSIVGCDCYNLGIDGRCIDAQVVKYKTYRNFHTKPRLIIQNVDRGTLSLSNGYEREQFLPYLFCDTLYQMTHESENFSKWDRVFPLIRYASYFQVIKEGLHLPNKLNETLLYKGYSGGSSAKWDGAVFRGITNISYDHHPAAVRIFDEYLSDCKNDGVEVVLVFAPIYIGVSEKMGEDVVQEMFHFYKGFADKYGFKIINFNYDSISYDTCYFYNATHMNKLGAELFSRKLANVLRDSGFYDSL